MNRDKVDILMEQLYAQMDEINLLTPALASEETEVLTRIEIPRRFSKRWQVKDVLLLPSPNYFNLLVVEEIYDTSPKNTDTSSTTT